MKLLLKVPFWLFFSFIFATISIFYYYSRDLPSYEKLLNYNPPSVTRIYTLDGRLVEQYSKEYRVFVPINAIPDTVINAFVAAEDKNFFRHAGVDIISIIRAATSDIDKIFSGQKLHGGSTITQQVVRNFLLTKQQVISRKVKEAVLSYRISKTLSKEKILELYLNQIYLGHGAYGVAAAAQVYFGKSMENLELEEVALIASLPKSPGKFILSKILHRRNYVIRRMLEDGYIDENTALKAMDKPIKLRSQRFDDILQADYYADEVRNEAIRMFGNEMFYSGGLTIISCIISDYQELATRSFIEAINAYGNKYGKYKKTNIGSDITDWKLELKNLNKQMSNKHIQYGMIAKILSNKVEIGLSDGEIITLSVGTEMPQAEIKKLSIRDIVLVTNFKDKKSVAHIPEVNGGFVVINYKTGQVYAMVGGYDYGMSKFNRTTMALRQCGSLIKAFIYLLALERNVTPDTLFSDTPITISQGHGMQSWTPKNYSGKFLGDITLREALEKSSNLASVRVALHVGIQNIVEIIKRFGINDKPAMFISIALGAVETTLMKITSAFATIANKGMLVTPHYIEIVKDRNGEVIYKRNNQVCLGCNNKDVPNLISARNTKQITDPASAYQITSILQGATIKGTSASLSSLKRIIAGKTGTTNNSFDTWYIGYTALPSLVVGTYIGFDRPSTLGGRATGSTVALPAFKNFMSVALTDYKLTEFEVPDNIRFAIVNGHNEAFKIRNNYVDESNNDFENQDIIDNKVNSTQSSQDVYEPIDKEDAKNPVQRLQDIIEKAKDLENGEVY